MTGHGTHSGTPAFIAFGVFDGKRIVAGWDHSVPKELVRFVVSQIGTVRYSEVRKRKKVLLSRHLHDWATGVVAMNKNEVVRALSLCPCQVERFAL